MAHDVFLSYSSADRATADAVVTGLEAQGVRCWMAPRDIPAGTEYGQEIIEAVKACRICVVIFSASANASPHVRREVERAVSAQKHLVPLSHRGSWLPPGPWNTPWVAHTGSMPSRARSSACSGAGGDRRAAAWGPGRRASGRLSTPGAPKPIPDRPSVVVLPFNNMSGDPEQEYFSDGITEDIITDLSKMSGLFVVARNTAFTYKGKPVKMRELCAELGVKFVLEGSVRKAGAGCA